MLGIIKGDTRSLDTGSYICFLSTVILILGPDLRGTHDFEDPYVAAWPLICEEHSRLASLEKESRECLPQDVEEKPAATRNWVAVEELKLSYYIGESLLFTIFTHYGNLI